MYLLTYFFQQDLEEVINILSSSSLENTPVKDKENNSHVRLDAWLIPEDLTNKKQAGPIELC